MVAVVITACQVNVGPSDGGYARMDARGPEVWTIEGRSYRVQSTYYLVIDNQAQFTVDYLCGDVCPDFTTLDDFTAFKAVYPLVKHMVESKLYERTAVQGKNGPLPYSVGVSMTDGRRGYRVRRPVDSVLATIKSGGP